MRFQHWMIVWLMASGWILEGSITMRAYSQTGSANTQTGQVTTQTGPARAETLLNGSSIAVAWLNLETSDVKAVEELLKLAGLPTDDMQWSFIVDFRAKLRESQATEVVLVGEFTSLIQGKPLFSIASKNPSVTKAFLDDALPTVDGVAKVVLGDAVLIGPPERIAALSENKSATADPKLLSKLKESTSDHGMILSIPKKSREMLSVFLLNNPNPDEAKEYLPMLTGFDSLHVTFDETRKALHSEIEFETAPVAEKFHKMLINIAKFDASLPKQYQPRADETAVRWDLESVSQIGQVLQATGGIRLAREQAKAMQSMNNMKQIALALHNFYSAFDTFPPQSLTSKDGKKLLSWRVLILPFIEQQALYEQFHLDEPWDSPHNRTLIDKMPQIFLTPGPDVGKTTYQALLTPNSTFGRPGKPVKFPDITDGTSGTIWMVEVDVADALEWTRPDDYQIKDEESLMKIYKQRDAVPFGFVDGSIRTIPKSLTFDTLKKLLSINGGEVVEAPTP